MKTQVILNERADEVPVVVITGLHTHLECLVGSSGCFDERCKLQLIFRVSVRRPLINQDCIGARALRHERSRIVFRPARPVGAEIPTKGILT